MQVIVCRIYMQETQETGHVSITNAGHTPDAKPQVNNTE